MARDILRSDLFSLASMAFSAGIALMAAVSYLLRGNGLGWAFAAATVMFVAAAVFVGRRSLNRLESANRWFRLTRYDQIILEGQMNFWTRTSMLALAVISALNFGRSTVSLDGPGLTGLGWISFILSALVILLSVGVLVVDFRRISGDQPPQH
jgi:hypothetical protein